MKLFACVSTLFCTLCGSSSGEGKVTLEGFHAAKATIEKVCNTQLNPQSTGAGSPVGFTAKLGANGEESVDLAKSNEDYAETAAPSGPQVYASLPINPAEINVVAGILGKFGRDFVQNNKNQLPNPMKN